MTLPHRLTAAVVGAGLAVLATGCGGEGDPQTADDPATATTSSVAPTASSGASSDGATGESSTDGGSTGGPVESVDPVPGAVAVYDVGRTPMGPRLYREFRSATGTGTADAPTAAVEMLTDAPTDPDYRTLWPAGSLSAVTVTDTQIDVVVDSSLAQRPADLSAAEARLAVQQVVYTLQGAAQQRLPVRFLIGDAPAATVLGVSTADPVAAGDELETLALVNVTTPEQGQTVTGHLVASGVASTFEGTVAWSVLDADGKEVQHGTAQTTGDYTSLTPWQVSVDATTLSAGDYTFVAMTDDPTGGEGPGPTEDTKAFTVS